MRVCAREGRVAHSRSLCCDAVGQAHSTMSSVVVTGAQKAGAESQRGIDRHRVGEAELSDVQGCIVFG